MYLIICLVVQSDLFPEGIDGLCSILLLPQTMRDGIFHGKGALWLAGGPVRGRKGATHVAVPRDAAGVLEDGTPAAPDPAGFAAGHGQKNIKSMLIMRGKSRVFYEYLAIENIF